MLNLARRYWKYIALLMIVLVVILFNYVQSVTSVTADVDEKMAITKKERTTTKNEEKVISTIFVDVKGSVNKPGVYELENGKRVIDAINKAGGLRSNADTINLNLSKKLTDEMIIIVYSKVEISTYYKNNNSRNAACASLECTCPDDFNEACISKSTKSTTKENTSTNKNAKVSINTATKEELMRLTGIGESKADKIISYRNENGNFETIEDIKKVSGIGDSIFNKIKDQITV